VLAIDADGQSGGQTRLDSRVYRNTRAVLAELAASVDDIHRYEDLQLFVSEHRSGLAVLANNPEPTRPADLQAVHRIAGSYYRLVVTDYGALRTDTSVLDLADQLVVVGRDDVLGAAEAEGALATLAACGYANLAASAVVALSGTNFRRRRLENTQLEQDLRVLRDQCAGAVAIPADSHLFNSSAIEMSWLSRETYDGYLELAALLLRAVP